MFELTPYLEAAGINDPLTKVHVVYSVIYIILVHCSLLSDLLSLCIVDYVMPNYQTESA